MIGRPALYNVSDVLGLRLHRRDCALRPGEDPGESRARQGHGGLRVLRGHQGHHQVLQGQFSRATFFIISCRIEIKPGLGKILLKLIYDTDTWKALYSVSFRYTGFRLYGLWIYGLFGFISVIWSMVNQILVVNFSDIWSFWLYGQLYQDKTVDHISESRCT